jgi:dihydroflavonol-4-reductase
MKACTQHQCVKRCMLMSSVAAILCTAKEDKPVPPDAFNETHWSNPGRPEGLMDYERSKTLDEKTAWDYQAAHAQPDGSFDLVTINATFIIVTINPTFIMGPAPICGQGSTSVQWMTATLDGSQKQIPRGRSGFVDVCDVALAHLRAIQIPEVANQRFILYNEMVSMPKVYEWLAPLNLKGAKVPTTLAEGDDSGGYLVDLVDNTRSKQVLQMEYTPLQQTVTDHAEQLLSLGVV